MACLVCQRNYRQANGKASEKIFNWIQSSNQFIDKNYNGFIRSVSFFPISYQLVFIESRRFNQNFASKLPLQGLQSWQMRHGHPKTRSNEIKFLCSNESNRQSYRCNFFH